MSTLENCTEQLDKVGADVLDVGCAWQEKSPMQSADHIGVLNFALMHLVFFLALAVVRSYLKPPST